MALIPTKKTAPTTRFEDMITLVYGAPKIGKSTFCSGFEDALFLDTEIGLKSLSIYRVGIDSWETFEAAYTELLQMKKAGKLPFKTLIFDTVDNLYMLCTNYVCKQNNFKHPSDLGYGKGWDMVFKTFNGAMQAYRSLDLGMVYVSHVSLSEIETRVGKYTRADVSLSGQANKAIVPTCDFILYATTESDKDGAEKRILRTKPSKHWNAGDRTGKLPENLPLDAKEFLKAFNEAIK